MSTYLLNDKVIAQIRAVTGRLMDHTITLQRPTAGAPNAYNQPTVSYGAHPASPVKAAFSQTPGAGERDTPTADYTLGRYSLLVPAGTDIQTSDRITSIKDRNGVEVDPAATVYNIIERVPGIAGLQLTIQKVS